MTTTHAPAPPDPSRTGAVWVTGTGAFLLLAAAAVFTAMRWDQIPDAAKLGALGLATGACLVAGRGLKASLPATAGALFHLGTFLVPLDVAAIGLRADLDWPALLLAQGLVATVTFGWAAVTERSVVLRAAFAAAVVALAGGLGATTALPAPLLLAGLATAAVAWRRDGLATGWAALAGLAPLLAFVERSSFTGAGTIERLGLTGAEPRAAAVLTGVVAATTLAAVGRRRDDAGLVLIGVVLATLGVVASWTGARPDASNTLVAAAAAFLAVELVAFLTRYDDFWRRPSGIVAIVAEWFATAGALVGATVVLLAPFDDGTDTRVALALLVLGVGWLMADRRRGSRDLLLALPAGAASVAGAVAAATTNDPVLAGALLAGAAFATLSSHRSGTLAATAAALWAPVVVHDHRVALVAAGALGSLVVAEAAVRRSRTVTLDPHRAEIAEQWAWILSAVALVPGGFALSGLVGQGGHPTLALIGGAVLATGLAAVADRGRVTGDLPLGTLPRVGALLVLVGTPGLEPTQVGLVALSVALLSIADAVRRSDPHVALGAALAAPVAIAALAQAADLSAPASGVALTVAAGVLTGLGALLGRRWVLPVAVAAGLSVAAGVVLAAGQPSAFADAIMVTGGIGLAIAVERGRLDGVLLSGLATTGGIWLRLGDADVVASEPYLLPIVVLLLGAGLRARSIGTSSWIAYGPAIGLLGGAALLERVSGGPGWHGLVAGTVGVVAVAAGGHRRLAAPLFLGTGLLVALVGYETLALTADLPTWTWLAVGGATLLAAGIAMERHDLGPLETGRRLVDVVDDHFA